MSVIPQPASIGAYKIVRTLGAGAMGPVYLGTHANQYWAVRVLGEHGIRPLAGMTRLVGDVLHPGLVRYRETGSDPAVGGFVSTDYVEAKQITRDGLEGLRLAERLRFIVRTLDALTFLHSKNLVHGTVKASNLLLRRRGNSAESILIDAAFAYRPRPSIASTLAADAWPGLAPEVIAAYSSGDPQTIDKAITARADVYGAGQLIAEILGGRRLFTGCRSAGEVIAAKRSGPISLVGISQPSAPFDLAALTAAVATATDPEPGNRQASAGQLADVLKAILPAQAAA